MKKRIVSHRDLEVYQKGMAAAMEIFELSKSFPKEETYSLTDQIRRSSRSACTNLVEAWRKRRYEKAFVSKLSDAEGEAAETQVWLEFSVKCNYLDREIGRRLYQPAAGDGATPRRARCRLPDHSATVGRDVARHPTGCPGGSGATRLLARPGRSSGAEAA
ncbi:MAG: four helix bundle protein [Caldilinea sp. CFX5]|nr:four helix bundle protein [Caldilinea sp. CFX5]